MLDCSRMVTSVRPVPPHSPVMWLLCGRSDCAYYTSNKDSLARHKAFHGNRSTTYIGHFFLWLLVVVFFNCCTSSILIGKNYRVSKNRKIINIFFHQTRFFETFSGENPSIQTPLGINIPTYVIGMPV